MADRGDTHYHVPNLNRWFAISSVVLLASALWMVLEDFNRPWKKYQRTYRDMEIERGRAELSSEDAQAALEAEARYAAELAEATAELEKRGGALEAARQEELVLIDQVAKADAAARVAKEEASWERYMVDEHRLHHPEDDHSEAIAELKELEATMMAKGNALKAAQAELAAHQDAMAELRAGVDAIEASMKASTRSIELTRRKMDAIDPEDAATKLANIVRDDIPGLDFVGPTIQVKKSIPADLTFELNFTKKPRIDMCQTCHVPIDKAGWEVDPETGEEIPHPYRTHPRLDLYLTAKSPHPMSEMGCTICHRGAGEALDFQRVDHRANTEAQGEEWYDEYHWHKQHYWDYPMLPEKYVEAGCVQCHKDSMELIEPDAPKVAEGYQLFERYGCYACHKVEWFPTKRRPGPSLKNVLQKTTPEFIASWIEDPKGFRPTTWMPKIFHLENYSPDQVIAKSNYGTGRDMMGDEWSDTALAAVTAFVQSRSGSEPMPEIPVAGDPLRGGEVFRLSGCLACHNMAPFEGETPELDDLALMERGTNEHGPNLRGIATKTTPEWMFAWIKNPSAYWSETRMPDLRLDDQDIADVVAYIFEDPDGIFQDVPEGWTEEMAPYKRDVLEEQARWFYNRRRPDELKASFEGEWADDQALLVEMGERWVLNYGCHSCHEIGGLEDANPIGAELTTWSSKTVDKLDFGFIPEQTAQGRGMKVGSNEFSHFVYEYKQYRENFLEQKLEAPRSYDRGKVKNPSERLKMPWFDFTDEEIEAITTFVAGLVEDEVPTARMIPSPEELAMDTGLRVMRQKNCEACHILEPGMVEWTDEDGNPHAVHGELTALEDRFLPPALSMALEGTDDVQAHLAQYVEDQRFDYDDDEYELEEVYVKLLETNVALGEVGETFPIENVESIRTTRPWGGDFVDVVNAFYTGPYTTVPGAFEVDEETGEEYPVEVGLSGDPDGEDRIQDVDGEWRDFSEEPFDKLRWTYAPPVLIGEGEKLQREWFYRFLIDPYPLRPQIRVKMPTFSWLPGEAGAVADYFAAKAKKEWPKEYARQMQRRLEQSPEDIATGIAAMVVPGSSAAQVEGIAQGMPVETAAGLPNLLAYGDAQGFQMDPAVDPTYERIPQRTPEGLDPLLAADPDFFQRVHTLATGPDGPKCNQCHFVAGEDPTNAAPIGWAPDLLYTRERLRPDWVRRWLTDPAKIYPGTTMPANFDLDSTQWQELYPAPSAEQIEAVTTWLFNLDRVLIED